MGYFKTYMFYCLVADGANPANSTAGWAIDLVRGRF